MEKVLNMTYASSLTELCAVNSSFDSGILRICYPGENRNKTALSKEDIERCLPSIYNCPIVCNYSREDNTLGGHDIELVRDSNGNLKIVNVTQPVGVIPESARVWFAPVEEEDGTIRDYLHVDALIWKRQEAYQKIKEDGVTAQSMEIKIKDSEVINGVLHIKDFEFTAFTLLGVEPCFESASLEMFSKQDFKFALSEMMQELKESFQTIAPSTSEVDNTHPQDNSTEGGNRTLDEKMNLVAQYGIDINNLEFSIEDMSIEELTEKFEAMKTAQPTATEPAVTEPIGATEPTPTGFALTSNIVDELYRVLGEIKITREWGECTRYWYVDCDLDATEVYCWDTEDWLLYGFKYSIDGDAITVDFESKKRKKYIIADFDEGEQNSPFMQAFSLLEDKLREHADIVAKYQTASETISTMETELSTLRKFKSDAEANEAKQKRDAIFAMFEDLAGIEAFEQLRENCVEYDNVTLEEKCFAIRGRNSTNAKFSLEPKAPKLKVDKTDISNEPYNGVFVKYGISTN